MVDSMLKPDKTSSEKASSSLLSSKAAKDFLSIADSGSRSTAFAQPLYTASPMHSGLWTSDSAQELMNTISNFNPLISDNIQSYFNQLSKIILPDVEKSFTAQFEPTMKAIAAAYPLDAFKSAIDAIRNLQWSDYRSPKETPESYSPEMTSPEDYFKPYEGMITSVADLQAAVALLSKKNERITLVWRGQGNSAWGLHSKLFRHLINQNDVKNPQNHPKGVQPYPTETQMVKAETEILRLAHDRWRLGNIPALEIFARIQHFGGPTRLLDATRNPYIAAWFAVQEDENKDNDGRLFALATSAVGSTPIQNLNEETQKFAPFWFNVNTFDSGPLVEWGTGSRRIIWVPPVYESRIAAQDAVFVLDGVPITTSKVLRRFPIAATLTKENSKRLYWKRTDILAAASIFAKMSRPDRTPRSNKLGLAPTYSFRIKAKAKKHIRKYLSETLGYTSASIYPDVPGLAAHLNGMNYPAL